MRYVLKNYHINIFFQHIVIMIHQHINNINIFIMRQPICKLISGEILHQGLHMSIYKISDFPTGTLSHRKKSSIMPSRSKLYWIIFKKFISAFIFIDYPFFYTYNIIIKMFHYISNILKGESP